MLKRELLEKAIEIVTEREATHSVEVRITFAKIARLWQEILGTPVTGKKVALCLIALKIVRLGQNAVHMDSWVDIAGYAACGAEIASQDMPEPNRASHP